MAFDIASQASGIDDSFFPIAPVLVERGKQEDNIDDRAWISGPRPGCWTIASTVNGSGIDDRTPTTIGLRAQSDNGSIAVAKRIDGSVLRKLAAATEAERKVKEETPKKVAAESGAVNKADEQNRTNSHKAKQGFYVPKLDGVFPLTYSNW